MSELYNKLSVALSEYRNAQSRGNGISGAKLRLSNLLFNNAQEILNSMKHSEDLEREVDVLKRDIESLQAALDDADAQYKELKATLSQHKTK